MIKTSTSYASLVGDRNDCSVRAHAIAANVDYALAHRLFADAGRQPNKGTSTRMTVELYARLGFTRIVTRVDLALTGAPRFMTVAQFVRAHPIGRFVLHRTGHAFAVVDGVVHDWARGTGATTRVRNAWQVSAPAARPVVAPADAPIVATPRPHGVGAFVRAQLFAGVSDAAILAAVRVRFPTAKTNAAHLTWYRAQMKRVGVK